MPESLQLVLLFAAFAIVLPAIVVYGLGGRRVARERREALALYTREFGPPLPDVTGIRSQVFTGENRHVLYLRFTSDWPTVDALLARVTGTGTYENFTANTVLPGTPLWWRVSPAMTYHAVGGWPAEHDQSWAFVAVDVANAQVYFCHRSWQEEQAPALG